MPHLVLAAAFSAAALQSGASQPPPPTVGARFPRPPWALEEAKLFSSDPGPVEQFGRSVDVDGELLIAGASHDDGGANYAGSAGVYRRSGAHWTEEARLVGPDPDAGDVLGTAVAIAGDTAVVGVPFDDEAGYNAGAAFVFVREGGSWAFETALIGAHTAAEDHLGNALAIDGERALVGAHRHDGAQLDAGAAHVFARHGGIWVEEARLLPSGSTPGVRFGAALDLDGPRAVVAAPEDDLGVADSGSVTLFVRAGTRWLEEATLRAPHPTTALSFGASVALSGDWLAVGATGAASAGPYAGEVHTFERTPAGWEARQVLVGQGVDAYDRFGISTALGATRLAVGAHRSGLAGPESGAVYVFELLDGTWVEEGTLQPADAEPGDLFGNAVALAGTTLVAGAVLEDGLGYDAGAAYVFRLQPKAP